jgi:monothiol glutaredoxin
MNTQETIRKQVTDSRVVLYMKGTPDAPQCGFSAAAVQILEACGADEVATVNVLADPDIRQGQGILNWPTIPQLYVMSLSAAPTSSARCTEGRIAKLLGK